MRYDSGYLTRNDKNSKFRGRDSEPGLCMTGSTLLNEIISTGTARVAEYSLSAHTKGREHIHNKVFEELFCLAGMLRIEIAGQEDAMLSAGEKVLIQAGTSHCVNNDGDEAARFLVVQGGGKFDLITAR
jgi:quercetin dioxygenase-like cupin family protein